MNRNLSISLGKYLATQDDPCAVLLSGGWGSGKTFYLQNVVKRIAESQNKKVIYLSLFGVENKDDFERLLLTRCIMHEGKKGKLFAMGLRYFQDKSKVSARDILGVWESLTENTLLVVDDLERVGSIDVIASILATLSNLVHENKLKVIVVANEDEILKLESSGKYTSWKEKLIRYTYKYSIDTKEIVEIVTGQLDKLCTKVVARDEAAQLIKRVVENSSCFNLRAYLKSVAQFAAFVDVLRNEDVFRDDVKKDLLQTILAINIEHSLDAKAIEHLTLAFNNSLDYIAFSLDSPTSKAANSFLLRHFGARHQGLVRIPHVPKAVLDGIWDAGAIKCEFQEEYSQRQRKPDELLLSDFRSLSDEEFVKATEALLSKINLAHFNHAIEVLIASDRMFYFSHNGLISAGPGAIRAALEGCLEKLPMDAFVGDLEDTLGNVLYSSHSFLNQDHNQFFEVFRKKWEDHRTERVKGKKKELIDNMANSLDPLIEALCSVTSDISRQPVFEEVDAKIITDALKQLQSPENTKFKHALLTRYNNGQLRSKFSQEENFVRALIRLLPSTPSDSADFPESEQKVRLSFFALTTLRNELNSLLSDDRQLTTQKLA